MNSFILDNNDVMAAQSVLDYLIKRNYGGIAQYSVVGEDRSVVKMDNTACIAQLSGYRHHTLPRLCVYLLVNTKREGSDELCPKRAKFFDYLVNRSFAKSCYVMPNHFNPSKNKCLVTRCDVPQGLFGFANNILRIGVENSAHLDCWIRLVDAGVNEDLAFLMCEYIDSKVDKGLVTFITRSPWSHSVMYKNSCTVFADILKGKEPLEETFGKTPYYKNSGYQTAHSLCGGDDFRRTLRKKLPNTMVEQEEERDLMGHTIKRACTVSGFTVNQLNTFWELY